MGHIKKGELTQEEKELLEVIGKGTGAGLVPGCCAPGRGCGGAWGRGQGPGDLGQLAIWKRKLGADCTGEGNIGGRSIAVIRSRLRSLNQLFGNGQTATTPLAL